MASETQCPDKGANSFQHFTTPVCNKNHSKPRPHGRWNTTCSAQLWQGPHSPRLSVEEPHVHALLPLNEGDEFRCIQGKARASQDQFPDQCL